MLLQGSTATVSLSTTTATKIYNTSTTSTMKKLEVENLSWAYELGLPVVNLLSVIYAEDSTTITGIVTTLATGYTLAELEAKGYYDLVDQSINTVEGYILLASQAGLYLTDLLDTDGNVRVTLDGKVTLVDVGDSL